MFTFALRLFKYLLSLQSFTHEKAQQGGKRINLGCKYGSCGGLIRISADTISPDGILSTDEQDFQSGNTAGGGNGGLIPKKGCTVLQHSGTKIANCGGGALHRELDWFN